MLPLIPRVTKKPRFLSDPSVSSNSLTSIANSLEIATSPHFSLVRNHTGFGIIVGEHDF